MNDNEKLEHFITCLRAEIEGKTIQSLIGLGWMDCHRAGVQHLSFNVFNASNWRVKPDAPKVVPFTFETAPDSVKVKQKGGPYRGRLVSHENCVTYEDSSRARVQYTYEEAAALFELLDGSPYGIEQKEESEWPKWAVDGVGDLWSADSVDGPVFLYRKKKDFRKESTTWSRWTQVLEETLFEARQIPAAEAERIIANAKEAK